MSTEKEIIIAQKSAIFDVLRLVRKDPNKTYTVDELDALLNAYVDGLEQK